MPERTTSPGPGLRIGTIAGVPVHLGWSWFALAAVITFVVGRQSADRSSLGYVLGLTYAVVLLLAVLAHEGAHAVAARAVGQRVHRVVADFLGGHTAFDSRSLTPGRSALIAAAGPLANLTLAGLGWVGSQVLGDSLAGWVLGGIGWVNLLLALFNLLPGLPLDGGQVLEALVWGVTGRRSAGLRAAGWVGRVLAVCLGLWAIGLPLLEGHAPDVLRIVWTLFLGSVIWRGATQALASAGARDALAGHTIDTVARPIAFVPGDTPVGRLATDPGTLVLVEQAGRYLLVQPPADGGMLPPETPVSALAVALPPDAVVESPPGDELLAAIGALHASRSSVVILTNGGRPWALTTVDDVNRALSVDRQN